MLGKIRSRYEKGKSKPIILIAICVKAITGVLGTSLILSQEHPYFAIATLALGAAINEILNFLNTEDNQPQNPIQP